MFRSQKDGVPKKRYSLFQLNAAKKERRRRRRGRRLHAETLESRRLLAADIDSFRHNLVDPEDVNNSGDVTPIDALIVINAMNRQGQGIGQGDGEMFTDVNNDGRRSALDALRVINRIGRGHHQNDRPQPSDQQPGDEPAVPSEVRSIDGTGNNLVDGDLGSTGEQLIRIAGDDYEDGISEPAGSDRPSARVISNVLAASDADGDSGDVASARDLSAFIYVWGQFLDHDIDLTLTQEDGGEQFDVDVPLGDPLFDPLGTGEKIISLIRSEFDPATGTSVENSRQQVNAVTSYIDGSMVYGADAETAAAVRSFIDGQLRVSDDGLLPVDEQGEVFAGDIRAAENLSLTAIQTLFVREHNRIAAQIAQGNPDLNDEEIYQQARAEVIGEIQAITFNEFLPALLGQDAVSDYRGYDDTVDPSIATEFSTAAFRFGHSTINDEVYFIDDAGNEVSESLSLTDAFFSSYLLEDYGIDSVLKSNASITSQEIDLEVVDSLRNFLFGPLGSGGLDLVALNIQRGRDHGLNDYNSTRVAYGLDEIDSFAEITSNTDLQSKLESLYGNVNHIDLWVGLMAEDHIDGSSVGELTNAIIVDQFERLRDGDRLWYENVFQGEDLRRLEQTSLSDVIERNTDVDGLQDNVFFFAPEISGRVAAVGPATLGDFGGPRRRQGHGVPNGVAGVTLQLMDDEGEVVSETTTDSSGRYRFDNMVQTGSFQVQIADDQGMEVVSTPALDVQISAGDSRIRDMDFQVLLA